MATAVPSGGWTWAKLQSLEVKLYESQAGATAEACRVEIEVFLSYPPKGFYLRQGWQ